MELGARLAPVRRATVGKNALDALALLFLLASGAFWAVLHWSALVVEGAGIPQMVVAIVMTAIYALALPLLLSMLAPSTPAGMLLQKTQWRTIGFAFIIGSAAFLGWHAKNLMLLWFSAQPLIDEADQETAYTIACLIGLVVIPALAWVQATPEQWLSAIQQAHAVRKLELQQNGEIAIIKARLLWAEQRAALSYANLLPAEQQEIHLTLEGLFKAIADNQRDIARTVGASATVERQLGSMGDREIERVMSNVAAQLEKPAQDLERYLTVQDEGERSVGRSVNDRTTDRTMVVSPHQEQDRTFARTTERPNERTTSGPLADHRTTERTPEWLHPQAYGLARKNLPSEWTRAMLENAVGCDEWQSSIYVAAWQAAGLVISLTEPEFHYRFTGGERPHSEAYAAARPALNGAWKSVELQDLLSISKTQAHTYLTAWIGAGLVVSLTEPKHHYQFVEV